MDIHLQKIASLLIFSPVALIFLWTSPGFSQPAERLEISCTVVKSVNQIKGEKDANIKAIEANRLAYSLQDVRPGEVTPHAIDLIATLLIDDNDTVKASAAASLGFIGNDAKSAIPLLKKALIDVKKNRDAPITGIRLSDVFCVALSRISTDTVPKECEP